MLTYCLVKAHYHQQNSKQEKESQENESPEDITIIGKTTYKLRNGRFRREFSQNKVISEGL